MSYPFSRIFKCALCRVVDDRRPAREQRKGKKDIRFYNQHRREWFQSVVNDIKDDPLHPSCFNWLIKNINRLNKINKTKNEKWQYVTVPKNPLMNATRCSVCRLHRLRRPKRDKLKRQKDRNFQRGHPREYYKTFLKYIKNNPIHDRCMDWLVKDITDLNKEENCEKIPIPQNSILQNDEESDDHWTDMDEDIDW